jgi:transcriptional regulator with GAF, ATPase, and Fis domain
VLSVSAPQDYVEIPQHAATKLHGLLAHSPKMRAMLAKLERVSGTDATVLIQGETGSGKERVAEAVHLGSPRSQQPLVILDCGAISRNLVEAELFGFERGAFTGAVKRRTGAFEAAQGGTVVLDEIGELPLDLQPKLLRVLESREVRRIGGEGVIPIDVRVVAVTNRDLMREVSAGRFREDLFFRLSVMTIDVPSLRERPEDIPFLAAEMLLELGLSPEPWLTESTLRALVDREWPGNVRELRNAIERAVAFGDPQLLGEQALRRLSPTPQPAVTPAEEPDLTVPLLVAKRQLSTDYESAYMRAMLRECGGNVTEAARRAQISRVLAHQIIRRDRLRDRTPLLPGVSPAETGSEDD